MKKLVLVMVCLLLLSACGGKIPPQMESLKPGDTVVTLEFEGYGIVKFKLVKEWDPRVKELWDRAVKEGGFENIFIIQNKLGGSTIVGKEDVIFIDKEDIPEKHNLNYGYFYGAVSLTLSEGQYISANLAFSVHEEGEFDEQIEFNQKSYGFSDEMKNWYKKYKGSSIAHGKVPVIGQVVEGMEVLKDIQANVIVIPENEVKVLHFNVEEYKGD